MADGKSFKGRVRATGLHKHNSRILSGEEHRRAYVGHDRFEILDNFPLPFCVVELVHGSTGRIVDFVFRYCNKAMAEFEGCNAEQMLGRSYYDIFNDKDKKWLDPYKDTVNKGAYLEAHDYHEHNGVYIKTVNYLIEPGLVGCMIQVKTDGKTDTPHMPQR